MIASRSLGVVAGQRLHGRGAVAARLDRGIDADAGGGVLLDAAHATTAAPHARRAEAGGQVPSMTSVSVSSLATMATLPSASTAEPVPVVALVTLVIDSTEGRAGHADRAARPAGGDGRISSLPGRHRDRPCVLAHRPSRPRGRWWCVLATSTSAPAPIPTVPAQRPSRRCPSGSGRCPRHRTDWAASAPALFWLTCALSAIRRWCVVIRVDAPAMVIAAVPAPGAGGRDGFDVVLVGGAHREALK